MIYVVQGPKNYLKLCDKPNAHHNRFGLIENNGTLNIKLGQLPKVPRIASTFVKSPNGSTKGVGGVNYDGWIVFPSQEAALKYLSNHYNIRLVHHFATIWIKNGRPLVIVPGLPSVQHASSSSARKLIDDWFRQMQDVLRDLKKRFGGVDVFFEGGGTVPIPDWFRDWCAQEGINITVGDGPPCDLDIQTNNNDRKFVEFWQAIKNLGPEGGVCPSQGRGATVKYRIENDRLILISEGRAPDANPMGTTKHTANVWFNKLQNGMTPFGNGGFRYNHSAWFHDVYVAILAI